MPPSDALRKRKVFFYSPGDIAPQGSGSAIRQFTNLRAYLDLGFNVEVIQFSKHDQANICLSESPGFVEHWARVEYSPRPASLLRRTSIYSGFPRSSVLEMIFPIHPFVVGEARKRELVAPGSIHHFEYIDTASSAISVPGITSIWSCHDIFSKRIPLLWQMRARKPEQKTRYHRARVQRLRQAEDWVAHRQALILNIASHEQQEFRFQRGYQNAEFFPMSWHDETPIPRLRTWMESGRLRLLHLGSVDGFLGYDSLRFILESVFPLLPVDDLGKMELLVVGRTGQSEYSSHIRKLAEPYPQVKFLGFVDDLKSLYAGTDLQVVGGTRATGMRTRIIDSFVYGVPVLSTIESARGLAHLSNGENIYLAEDAPAFAAALSAVYGNPQRLMQIAYAARQTYERNYSRSIAAAKLAALLEQYL